MSKQKETIMEWAGYWDESEFNFFKTLEDDDKLMYIYDLCLGEFHADFISEEEEMEIRNSMEEALRSMGESLEEPEEESIRQPIKVELGLDKLTITGPTLDILLKVASDMQMNGLLLMDRKITFTKYEPWDVVLEYNVIGSAPPFSIN